jgi:thioredoxin 1
MTKENMKLSYFITLLFLTLTVTTQSQVPDSLKVRSLPPSEFLTAFQKSGKPLMIDVSEFFEYKKSRIKNAINIPSSGHLGTAADTIDKSLDLFFYCTSGFRSKRVAKYFYEHGFPIVYSLDGGIIAWRKAGFEVEKKKLGKKDARRRVS